MPTNRLISAFPVNSINTKIAETEIATANQVHLVPKLLSSLDEPQTRSLRYFSKAGSTESKFSTE
jgi:hypothetical protein